MLRRASCLVRGLILGVRQILPRTSLAGQESLVAIVLVGGIAGLGVALFSNPMLSARARPAPAMPPHATSSEDVETVLRTYCVVCHNQSLNTAGLALDRLDVTQPSGEAEVWEKVIRKLRTRAMPPGGQPRPDEATYDSVATWLEGEIDRAWVANPNPGTSSAVHRLNVAEYNNAVRDLFALDDIDVRSLLPGDETADGSFDNFADVLTLSPGHVERYISVARTVTRLAVGLPPAGPVVETFEVPKHIVQDDRRSEDLPFGSRGGLAIRHHFPVDGEYLIKVRLRSNWQDYRMGMGWPQQLDVRVDGRLLERFTVGGDAPGYPSPASFAGPGDGPDGGPEDPEWQRYMLTVADDHLEVRVPVEAGPRVVGVTFVNEWWEPEGVPQAVQRGSVLANDELYLGYAAVGAVEITGPYGITGLAKETLSHREIFVCEPVPGAVEEEACATEILSRMARRAYRRPVTEHEAETLVGFFHEGRQNAGSFAAGIQFALEYLLVSPAFLLRVYQDPPEALPGEAYPLSDLELASRLSFFLWSSIPDEPLLDLAESGELTNPVVLEQQVRRMLADPRAIDALVTNFAGQWLNLRRVSEVLVDPELYPDVDDNLLEGFQRETELFVASTLREDRNVLDLLGADYTYVNEQLARHYGIPGMIYGTRFRRVSLPNREQRGGLLAQGAVLAVSSYPHRTSPVLRGKWLLDNILGSPPPAPPPNVPELPEAASGELSTSVRERLAQHRNNEECASCHLLIDPLGFSLENFDVVGGWRTIDEAGYPIDAVGTMQSGEEINGFSDLRAVLQSERFVVTVTEKLMAYALGRRLQYYDQPAVRQIVRDAAAEDYRWSSIILGIVQSPAFLMRSAAQA